MKLNAIKIKSAIEEACDKHLEGIAQMFFISPEGEAALKHFKEQIVQAEAKRSVALKMVEELK